MAKSLDEVQITKFKKRSFLPEDHISKIFLTELEYEDNSTSLTFGQGFGSSIVSFERLTEIHKLISKTLENEKEYREYKKWIDSQRNEFYKGYLDL